MEKEVSILAVKPNSISSEDKKILGDNGIIVIETENPNDIKFMRPSHDISYGDLLQCALETISHDCQAPGKSYFANKIIKAVLQNKSPN